LPSHLVKHGDTLDLRCAEVAIGYEAYAVKNPDKKTNHGYNQEDLLAQLEAVRNAQNRT